MGRKFSLFILATFIGVLSTLLVFMSAQAQIDAFTYYISFPADRLDDLFDRANNDNNFIDDDIVTTISISVMRSDTIIYYDHWEDNPELNLTSPNQSATLIWGDNDPSNGIPPGFATDILQAGDIITLRNTVALPRDRNEYFFDGGDKLTAKGGNLAVSLVTWPDSAGSLFAGAWSLLPTSNWGTEYIVPVGVDLAGVRPGFGVAGVNVQAVEDDTTVQLDLNADGSFETTLTLDQGQQFTDISGSANTGGRILASKPVQAHLFTGNPTPGVNFEARVVTLGHRGLWTGDYLAPRSSDGDYWLFNPDPNNDLIVTAQTVTNSTVITIPPASTVRYPPLPAGLSAATGVRFTSVDGRPFAGLTALDESSAQDWGYGMLPVEFLTSQVLVGWAPGNNTIGVNPTPLCGNPPPPGDESRIYVTAITTTTINVDYDLDFVVDATFTITPLNEVDIIDPSDCDMTGAFLYSSDGTPFVSVWGQDESAPPGQPSIDVGTGLGPLASLAVQKIIDLVDDADGSGTITWGDTVRFQIFALNNTIFLIEPAVISDTLSESVDYIMQTSTLRGLSIADDLPPRTPFPFDESGYVIPGGLQPQEIVTATFDALVVENTDSISNTVCVDSPSVPVPGCGEVKVPVQVPRLEMSKRRLVPVNGIAEAGDVVIFGINITSTGNISITKLPLRDEYDENHLTFQEAAPFPPDITAPGVITWTDLATVTRFGPLPPGRTVDLTVTFTVKEIPPNITKTINVAIVRGAEGSDGSKLPPITDDAEVFFPLPTPTLPAEEDDDGPSAPTSTPQPPAPTPLPTIAPSPIPTSELPVAVLPETGSRSSRPGGEALVLLLLLMIGLTVFAIWSTRPTHDG